MSDNTEYYDLLGVESNASTAEIRQSFRKLALTHHPDRGGDEETFTQISKAYEVLSDPKARARYDTTGRTAGLTVEEELREAFFGGGGLGSSTRDDRRRPGGGGLSEAEKEKRAAQEAERLEAKRRLEETERRDAERRARLAGGQPPTASNGSSGYPSQPSAAPSRPAAAQAAAPPVGHDDFSIGDRVELVGLKKTPELLGLRGTLVGERDGRWQIRLDGGKGDKLLKAANLSKISSAKAQAAAAAAPNVSRAGYSVVGSWNSWTPQGMTWDAGRRCYFYNLDLPNSGAASFQIWKGGEVSQCLHPDSQSACPQIAHRLCGPDDRGHGLDWAIGKHPSDRQRPGNRVEIRLHVRSDGTCEKVEWAQGKAPSPAASQAAAKGKAAAKAKGVAKVAAPVEPIRTPMPPLPAQSFLVVHEQVFVRAQPGLAAEALGTLDAGQYVEATEETFDGWVKLDSDDGTVGWALKDMRGKKGLGELMARAGRILPLGASQLSDRGGPQKFRVTFKPKVVVRDAPIKTANIRKIKQFGAEVMADTQTYNGWIRLMDDEGWMLISDPEFGQLLEPLWVKEQQTRESVRVEAEEMLEDSLATKDVGQLQEAIRKAKAAKAGAGVLKQAADRLSALHEDQSRRERIRQRIDVAVNSEKDLRECIDECTREGWHQETLYAKKLLDHLLVEQELTAKEHKSQLDEFWEATVAGDPLAIKTARDAAKKAGVPMKEIARVYALAQARREEIAVGEAGEAEAVQAEAQEAPPPAEEATPAAAPAAAPAPAPAPAPVPAPAQEELAKDREEEIAKEPASEEEKAGVESGLFDGCWQEQATGEFMATISGLTVLSPDGQIQEAQLHGDQGLAFEMCGELFSATLDEQGQLVWSDGDIWVRKTQAEPSQTPAACDAEATMGDSSANTSAPQAAARGSDEADSAFDGYWIGADGEHMATIKGFRIHWDGSDGSPQELTRTAADAISTELFGEALSARLDADGRLLWNDGDVWTRTTA